MNMNTMTVRLTHEQASLIKNLLNKERMHYKSIQDNPLSSPGAYLKTIESTLSAMAQDTISKTPQSE